MARPLSERR